MIPKERGSMAETITRRDPLPSAPAIYPSVTISLAPPVKRWSLRARDPKTLEKLAGNKLPRKIGETLGDIACLGPDEWLWRAIGANPKNMGADQAVSIVDVSERSVGIVLEGPGARAVLNAGCPLDLERFAIGRTVRTIYEGVEIILHRESETSWNVDVWRSFAEWLSLSFNTAAAHP
jgi:sarcosine oxidase, subunit gamma